MTGHHARPQHLGFRSEIRHALRYEKGLVAKALLVLALVVIIVIVRTLYFA